MNVENGFKIFKYNGVGPVVHQEIERAYDTMWRPAATGVYPNRAPSPRKPSAADGSESHEKAVVVPVVAAPVKVAAYRPPGSSGSLSNFMNRESGPAVGKVKKDATGTVKPAAYVPPTQKQRVIPGMAPAAANVKKPVVGAPPAAAKSTAPAAKAPAPAKQPTAPAVKLVSAPAPVVAAPAPVAVEPESAVDKEKRVKGLRKKLKQLDEIKAKRTAGQTLEPEQVSIEFILDGSEFNGLHLTFLCAF